MINLINGDMFLYHSDLLVISCDTDGSVTYHVYQNIELGHYPKLEEIELSAGSLVCKECYPNSLHKYVAYAAAVENKDGWSKYGINQTNYRKSFVF